MIGRVRAQWRCMAYNLLDNSNFAHPVNQRNVTTAFAAGYCIDRWVLGMSGTGYLNVEYGDARMNAPDEDGYVDISQVQEHSDQLTGKAMTLAAYVSSYGTLVLNFIYGTNAAQHSKDGQVSLIHYNGDRVFIRANHTGTSWIAVKWAALYEGTYTAENLPPYIPKSFSAEMLECSRYFCRIGVGNYPGFVTSTATRLYINNLVTGVSMAKTPTISIYGNAYVIRTISGYSTLASDSAPAAPSAGTALASTYGVPLWLTWGGATIATNNTPAALEIRPGAYFDLVADL